MHVTGVYCFEQSKVYTSFSDINECFAKNGNCSQTCINTIGSYDCACRSGFQLTADNMTCTGTYTECSYRMHVTGVYCFEQSKVYTSFSDINECFAKNGNCSQTCINTIGSYHCACHSGFQLTADNMTCTGTCKMHVLNANAYVELHGVYCFEQSKVYTSFSDINECFAKNGNCSQTCINTIGSYHCACRSGFQLTADNMTCIGTCTIGMLACICRLLCLQVEAFLKCALPKMEAAHVLITAFGNAVIVLVSHSSGYILLVN